MCSHASASIRKIRWFVTLTHTNNSSGAEINVEGLEKADDVGKMIRRSPATSVSIQHLRGTGGRYTAPAYVTL